MTTLRSRGLVAAALVLCAWPLAAQRPVQERGASVFTQSFQPNPFNALLPAKFSLGGSFGGEVSNNAIDVGDGVAVLVIACNPPGGKILTNFSCENPQSNMRPSDLLLIAGILPSGEDARIRMNMSADMGMTIPTRWGTFGLTSSGRSIARMNIPANMTALLRDGFTGDTLHLNLGGLTASAIAYADAGLLWLRDVPFTGSTAGNVPRYRMGVGAHYLRPISNPTVSFLDTNAARTPSTVAVSAKDSVSANITMITPTDVLVQSGSGWAYDFYAVADFGPKLQVSGLLSNVGSMTITQRPLEIKRLQDSRMSIDEFQQKLDSMPVDTIAGSQNTITLPRSLRLEASYRPFKRFGFGMAIDKALESEWSTDALRTTFVMELGFPTWIPLRVGMHTGTDKVPSAFAGLGLRTGHFISEIELVSRGFPFDKARGAAIRTGGALVF